jgi:hypothetical protein
MVWWLDQHNMVSPISDHWGAVPEPSTITLFLIALGVVMLSTQKKRKEALTKSHQVPPLAYPAVPFQVGMPVEKMS